MINLTENYIKRITGEAVFSRAKEYYNSGMIIQLDRIYKNLYHSVIAGSSDSFYQVNVDLNTESYYCTCPYKGTCKHIGAVLLNIIDDYGADLGIENSVTAFDRVTANRNEISAGSTSAYRLNSSETDDEFIKTFNYMMPEERDQTKRYMAAFELTEDRYPVSEMRYVQLKMRYIKQDGTHGAVTNCSLKKITEEMTPEEYALALKLNDSLDKKIRITEILDYIVKNRITLFINRGDRDETVKIRYMDRLHLTFQIYTITDSILQFIPCAGAETFSGGIYYSSPDQIIHNEFMLVLVNGNEIYYSTDAMITLFISKLNRRTYHNCLNLVQINSLIAYCKEKFPDQIKIDFPWETAEICRHEPEPVIEITESGMFNEKHIAVKLLFDYYSMEYDYPGKESFIKIETDAENRKLLLAYRADDFEKSVFSYLKVLFTEKDHLRYGNFHMQFMPSGNTLELELDSAQEFIRQYGKILVDKNIKIKINRSKKSSAVRQAKLQIKVKSELDWFNLEITDADNPGNLFEIKSEFIQYGMLKSGDSLLIVSDDDILKISRLLENQMNSSGQLKISSGDIGKIHEIYSLLKDDDVRNELREKALLYEKLTNAVSIKNEKLPKNFKAKLRPYQKTGYNWLCFLHENSINGCLADDMGLGKTIQTLCFLQKLKENSILKPVLLVVPVSTISNWIDECARFTPEIKMYRYTGPQRNKNISADDDFDIIITSYSTLVRDIGILGKISFTYCILDEAQNIKNASTAAFKNVSSVKAEHRLSLTGTPVENSTSELWAQMNFLNPGLLGSFSGFRKKYGNAIEKYGSIQTADELRTRISPFILRRKKDEVAADLPEKEEIVLYCEMNDDQRKVYDGYLEYYRKILLPPEKNITGNISAPGHFDYFSALLKLRQASLFSEIADSSHKNISSCKFEMFIEMCREILTENHKILIFSQFVSVLDIIRKHFEKENIQYSYLDGQTRNRKEQIELFQKDENCRVFLISLKAGGTGINLTSADYVFLFDPWWNPAVENQAVDRAHRIGQNKKVIVYRMIAKDTVEEKIMILQQKKKDLVRDIISDDSGIISKLNKDDLAALFE
ncbi:MAG: DEAD/DEAH box helicase [Spirochaetes bacterium]|nr:DEAD/DEAH box helicase [Spirochaetota bacterium]